MLPSQTTAKSVSVKLDSSTRTRIENLANVHQRTSHWLMRQAILQYLEREEKKEACRQETLRAWNEYQETGLHATSEEINSWLASWGSSEEQLSPTCHP